VVFLYTRGGIAVQVGRLRVKNRPARPCQELHLTASPHFRAMLCRRLGERIKGNPPNGIDRKIMETEEEQSHSEKREEAAAQSILRLDET
jgi:hypothetical protein